MEPEPPRPAPTIKVTLTISDSSVVPGASPTVTTEATATNGRLETHGVTIGGLFDTTLSFPIFDRASQAFVITFEFPHGPIEGELTFSTFARATSLGGSAVDTARGRIVITDDGPPRATLSMPSFRLPGDTLRVVATADDAAGITTVELQITGVAAASFAASYDLVPSVSRALEALIPSAAALADSAIVVLTARDSFDKQTQIRRIVRLIDTIPPVVSAVLHFKEYDYWEPLTPTWPTLFAGDTARLTVHATDNYRLGWIGYRLDGKRDSLPFANRRDSVQFSFPAPTGVNATATLSWFARDSTGTESYDIRYIELVDAVRRPISSLSPFGQAGNMHRDRYGYDPKRDILFVVDDSGIAVLALDPPSYLAPIPIAGVVASLDLTRSGDSLVVLVHRGNASFMDIVDLTRQPWAADTVRLGEIGARYGFDLRVDANNRALITVSDFFLNPAYHLLEFDLATRGQRLRPVPAWPLALARSGDGSLLVAMGARGMATYDVTADLFSPVNPMPDLSLTDPEYLGWPGIDDAGSQLLFATRLYDRTLTSSRLLPVPCQLNNVVRALSADGEWAYLAERDGCARTGYQRVHTATGAIAETVYLPFNPFRLVPLPDGRRLLVAAENWLGVVDLR